MPLVKRFANKLAIYIYAAPREHPPPHFHIVGPETNVSIEIATLRVVEGKYRPQDVGDLMAWAAANLPELLALWELYNERD
jgi:hypothetical protein